MKHKVMLVLVILAVFALSISVSAQEPRTVRIGLSWNQYDVSLVYAWEAYMQAQGVVQGEAAGLNIEWVINAADGDPARQAANIEDLLNQGVDLIIARAEDSAAIGSSVRAAQDAGVPFITFDRASKTTAPTAHVGGDSYAQALTTAEAFAQLLTDNGVTGSCIELQGALTDENAVNRSVAWNEFDATSDAFQTIAQVPTDWDATLFLSGATNALQANPDANCMFLASDFAITSVQSALESAGRWAPVGDPNHMWLATQDLFPEALTLMEAGYVDVTTTYDAFAHAQEAVRVAIAILNGEDPACGENGCLVAGRVATPETVGGLDNLWSRDFANGAPAEARTVRVGLSWNQYDVSLVYAWEAYMQAQGVEQGAAAGLNIEWVINAADGDPARQAANIEDLINQGVDIIIARAEDSAAIGSSVRAAQDAGVPFITFDRASKTTTPSAHVGGDSYAQALTTAEAFATLLTANGVTGSCIELQGALTDENAVNRSVAWNEFDATSDAFQTIAQVPTDWDATLFLSGATNALQANPDANCMFLASDFAITSVQSALESAGRWAPVGDPNHMWLATQDLFPEALTLMEQGYVDVTTTYDAFAHAQEAVRVAIAILNGEDPACGENGCLVAGRVATPETVGGLDNLWSRDFSGS